MKPSCDEEDWDIASEDAVVAALLAHHNSKQQSRRSEADEYSRILDHFQRRGERQRGERLLTQELLTRLVDGARQWPEPARHRHQELELFGREGGRAAGRVRIRNRSTETADFELVALTPLEQTRACTVEIEPRSGTLTPGSTSVARVSVDLRYWRAHETATIPLVCRWPRGRDQIWLLVRAEAR